ncbi:hypothetical protein AAE478_007032 [Parahypoxylon ruwenzoriense]
MESWFRLVGRPALLDALAGACDQIDNELGNVLKSYIEENAQLSAELESLKSMVSDVNQLKEENQSLKAELQNLKTAAPKDTSIHSQSRPYDVARISRAPLAPKSVNQVTSPRQSIKPNTPSIDKLELSELREEFVKLDGRYAKLRGNLIELQNANAELTRLLRERTKTYNQWKDHANQLDEICHKRSRKIKKLEARLAVTSDQLDASFSSDTPVRPASRLHLDTPEAVDLDTHSEPVLAERDLPPRVPTPRWTPSHDTGHTSRESTASTVSVKPMRLGNETRASDGGDDTPNSESRIGTEDREESSLPPLPLNRDITSDEVSIKNELSSDTPVVVSERCLRKRKHGDDQAEDTRTLAIVKTEKDDDLLITNERRRLVPQESIDFDAEGSRVETPRKRNRPNRRPEDEDMSILGRVGAPRPRDYSSPLATAADNSIRDAAIRRPSLTRLPLGGNPKNLCLGERDVIESLELQENHPSRLKPSYRNAIPHQILGTDDIAKQREPFSRRNGLADLAEDGDQYQAPATSVVGKPRSGRLQVLLNEHSRIHEITAPSPGAQLDHISTLAPFEFQLPQKRELPFGKGSSKRLIKVTQSHSSPAIPGNRRASAIMNTTRASDQKETSGTTDYTPLRVRPKSQLSLGDFKINPNVNGGHDYAFTDVVRNKEERAGLAGCVNDTCCGQTFRFQARVERDKANALEFQLLLENYLGDEASRLPTMTVPEKENLWLEAKARELANEHGRHRHRFQRAPSPEGFWRTDFPSTQEELEDKEEAAKMERQIVDERYREAMRPGGRWLFRDE